MIGRTNCTQKSGSPSEFVNIQLLTNQAEHSNLNGAVIRMSYETYSKQYTWDGKEITFSVPAHVSCTIEFPEVEGYKKPDNINFVAVEGNSRTIEAEYKAELVKVNVTSSNGSAVSGATITINGKQQTWNGTEIRQLVPFGTQYSVVAGAVSGFGTPSTQTFTAQNPEREVSVVYIASSLKVNILSNQGADTAIANVKATVKYGSTSVQVANGGTVNLPTNTSVTISFPEVADYKKPADITYTHTGGLVEKSGTYQCELLTVNVSADSGSVSGFEVTISKQETVGVATKYTKLEYIESNGYQYIDTGLKATEKTKVELKVSAVNAHFFSAVSGSSSVRFGIYALTSNSLDIAFGGSGYKGSVITNISYPAVITLENGKATAGSSSYTFQSQASFVSPSNIFIFSEGSSTVAGGKLYYYRIYESGVLIRDYIPALRSDGIVGLYDAVNDTFTASSGSGNFIAGGEQKETIATQTSVTGSYKIPFNVSYTVQASKVSGYDTPKPITRIANTKSYTAVQQYTVVKVRDLSMMDIYGNPINQSTANCYVVREAGQYKFPIVYGNAIKNGKVNTAAFTNNGGSNSHNFQGRVNVITQPYIELGSTYSARIYNSDTDGVVSNVEVIDGENCKYIQVNVDEVPSVGANVQIAVIDTVMPYWSWHIWLWPHDLTPVEITNSTGVKYNIMPVNLASKYDEDGVHIKNWFYQWGRKDPMLLPSAWNSTIDHTPGGINKSSKKDSPGWAVQYPATFYYNSKTPFNWFGNKSYYNLWDAACTSSGASDNDTVKTVYDPCPVGWKVPNGKTFNGLSVLSVGDGVINIKRYNEDTVGVKFPLSLYRKSADGVIGNYNSYSYIWDASSADNRYGHAVTLYVYGINSTNSSLNKATGASIRPVQDDLTKIDSI